jgi:hypothetical protein
MSEPVHDALKQKKRRNLAIALGVAGFVILVFLVTMLRLYMNIRTGGAP